MMKLYTVPLAPNPMRVTLYCAEREALGCHFDIEQVIVTNNRNTFRETPGALCRCLNCHRGALLPSH